MSMTRRKRLQYAEKFFVMAQDFQNMGYYNDAAHYYTKSIQMYPTPEAYTHLAWAHSFLGEYDQAIEFCKIAISLDPDYGNPYNDIGAYLMEKGDVDSAIPYLRRAARARRYDQHHYAHFNLGRAWEKKHQYDKAVVEYKRSLEMAGGMDLCATPRHWYVVCVTWIDNIDKPTLEQSHASTGLPATPTTLGSDPYKTSRV